MSIVRPAPAESGGFDRVFAFLPDQLFSWAINPDDRLLGEHDLPVRLGVSWPVLREALRTLAMLGVLDSRQGVGAVVQRPDAAVPGRFSAFALARQCAPGR